MFMAPDFFFLWWKFACNMVLHQKHLLVFSKWKQTETKVYVNKILQRRPPDFPHNFLLRKIVWKAFATFWNSNLINYFAVFRFSSFEYNLIVLLEKATQCGWRTLAVALRTTIREIWVLFVTSLLRLVLQYTTFQLWLTTKIFIYIK